MQILTVDDSKAIRTIVKKAFNNTGYDILEAENGEEGLSKLAEGGIDLVLLDVTMPVMDGPAMLVQMRSRGDKTPVLVLTAESKNSLIASMIQAGISDYILKPFKEDALLSKVEKILNKTIQAHDDAVSESMASVTSSKTSASGKAVVDVLLIDDMENVAKKLKEVLPPHIKVMNCLDSQSAINTCKDLVFRTIIIDVDIPNVNSRILLSQLRALQPIAGFMGLFMRTVENRVQLAKEQGFDGHLIKPFDATQLDEFLEKYFQAGDMLVLEGNVLTVSDFGGKKERLERNYLRLNKLIDESISKIAAACHETVIIDFSKTPDTSKLPKVIIHSQQQATEMGIQLRAVMNPDMGKVYKTYQETKDLEIFSTLSEART